MNEQKYLFLAFVFLVLISGCTTPVPKPAGVVIESFTTDFSEVYPGEPVSFRVKIRNTGSVDAENVFAELYGLDESWCESSVKCDKKTREVFPNEEECRYDGNGFSLEAPDPLRKTKGESHVCTWSYTAPDIPPGFSIHYTPKVGIFYTYRSITIQSITLLPQNELIRIKDSHLPLPTETVSTTNSPIHISVETLSPVRYWKSTETIETPIKITITNLGDGFPCYGPTEKPPHKSCKSLCQNCKDKVKVYVQPLDEDIIPKDCKEVTKDPIFLPYGKSNSFVCYIKIKNLPKYRAVQKNIKVEAVYEYYTEKEISLTLKNTYTRRQ